MSKRAVAAMDAASQAFKAAGSVWKAVDAWTSQKNHPAWYTHYPVAGLVQLNFGRRETCLVSDPDRSVISQNGFTVESPKDAIINVYLTTPRTKGRLDSLKEAAGVILNQMRSVSTTTAPYTTEDIERYLENLRVIMAAYAQVRRLADSLGIADTYDQDSYVKYALAALPNGVPYSTVIAEKAQLEAALSSLTPTLVNLFPAQVDVIERMKWLFANVFCDSPSAKFNAKMFRCTRWEMTDANGMPHMFYMEEFTIRANSAAPQATTQLPDEASVTSPGVSGKTIYLHRIAATPTAFVTMIRRMIGLMLQDTSSSRIAGDLLKAFGQSAFMVIPEYVPNQRAPFVYDEDVLNQIQNISIFACDPTVPLDFAIDGNTPIGERSEVLVKDEPFVTAGLAQHIITTYRNEVDAGRILSMTRMSGYGTTVSLQEPSASYSYVKPTTMGTEIILSYSYIQIDGNRSDLSLRLDYPLAITTASSGSANIRRVIQGWASDDWAPMMSLLMTPISGMPPVSAIDMQNWATMTEDDQAAFTNIATLSLYTIPILVSKQDTFAFVG